VFTGGWTLASAEAVCDPGELGLDVLEGLTSLVDQSLVRRTESGVGESRFAMLETIREFAQEQLRAGDDLELVLRRHGEHFLGLAVAAEPHLTGEDQGEWLDRCDREHANLRAALRWAIEAGEADRVQRAAGALWGFWQQRGHLAEGRRWLEEIQALPSGQAPTAARAKALTGAGGIAWWQEDIAAARGFYQEALAIERELGNPAGIAEGLYNLAFVAGAGGDIDAAVGLFEESLELFRRAGDEGGVTRARWMIVLGDLAAGNWEPRSPTPRRPWPPGVGRGTASAWEMGWSGWPSSTPAPAASRTPGRPSWRCSVRSTARLASSRSSLACPTWRGGKAATRMPSGWPAPPNPSANGSAAGRPSTSSPGSSGTQRPRPEPTSKRTPPSGPGRRAAP
jgi:tetratricopeptide (TPR) repeat protein